MAGYLRDQGIDGCADWRTHCHGRRIDTSVRGSDPLGDAFFHVYDVYRPRLLATGRLLLVLPALIGVFVGAPAFARELESGTYQLVWTQSVSRTRWLAAKLALPLTAALAGTTLLAALYTWWWRDARAVTVTDIAWGDAVPFDASGPALVALAPLSFLLGAAIGLVVARTLPAMVATLAATVGLLYGLEALRPQLMPTRTMVSDAHGDFGSTPQDVFYTSWRGMGDGYLTGSGRVSEEYHPASHFWPLQWIQAGICTALALALAAFCFWWIRRRPA